MTTPKWFEFDGPKASVWEQRSRFYFQPDKPFKPFGILTWEPGDGYLHDFLVAAVKQVLAPIPLRIFQSPFPVAKVHQLLEWRALERCLPPQAVQLRFPILDTGHGAEVTISGSCGHFMVWGVYLEGGQAA